MQARPPHRNRNTPDARAWPSGRWWIAFAGIAACAGVVLAQPVALPATAAHPVVAGDTLSALALRYGGDARLWPRLQQLNRLENPHRLMPGAWLVLPPQWVRPSAVFVEVTFVHGQAFLTPPGGARAPLTPGMRPGEGGLIEVAADSAVHLRLSDGSVMQLAPGTRVRLDRLRQSGHAIAPVVRWSLENGRVESHVIPQPVRGRRFEVHTPYAVASVRGTEFAVTVAPGVETRSEVFSGAVELRHPRAGAVQVRAGQGTHARAQGVAPPRALPDAPALPAALADQVVAGQAVSLLLPEPPDGQRWRVRVTPPGEPGHVLREAGGAGARVDFAALPAGPYSVWVQAHGPDGLLGPPAQGSWQLRPLPAPPLYVSPAADAVVTGPAVELRCTHPAQAQAFRLDVSTRPDFSELIGSLQALPECRHQVSLAPGRYHWRVASVARDADGRLLAGAFSAGRAFEVRPPPPGPPTANATEHDGGLHVHWDPHPGWTYRVQVSSRDDFTHLLHDELTPRPHLSLPDWPAGHYAVRLQAIDGWGQSSPFSPPQAVHVRPVWRSGSGLVWHSQDGRRLAVDAAP